MDKDGQKSLLVDNFTGGEKSLSYFPSTCPWVKYTPKATKFNILPLSDICASYAE